MAPEQFPSVDDISDASKAMCWLKNYVILPSDDLAFILRKFNDCPLGAIAAIFEGVTNGKMEECIKQGQKDQVESIVRESFRRVYQVKEITAMNTDECWSNLKNSGWDVQKALKEHISNHPRPHSFPALMSESEFIQVEVDNRAPLFDRNVRGWLQSNRESVSARVKQWVERIDQSYRTPLVLIPIPTSEFDAETPRIIINDSTRTFHTARYQFKLATYLHSFWKECGSYSQSMSYLAAILLLSLNEQETAWIMRKVNSEYIPGHWAAQASGFNTSAFVWDKLLGEIDPEIQLHFQALNFLPDTYLQKIFSALCIHVLEFDMLYDFLDAFLMDGFPFLLRFAIALAVHFKPRLMTMTAIKVNQCFDIMKMDAALVSRSDQLIVLESAKKMNISAYIPLLKAWRDDIYTNIIEPRMKKASGVEYEPCVICEAEKPVFYCDACGILCAKCASKSVEKGVVVSASGVIEHRPAHTVSEW
ncbi:GTPase activating protein [Perkinsela sp. CCAP 1560/4]|nr:GTPase activating protein [Perkinsela sp. CCAP 1560/4]|eukprot:KNH09364.1 GTPase activating protein [Perkinsela sp. CCAP 1560/4]